MEEKLSIEYIIYKNAHTTFKFKKQKRAAIKINNMTLKGHWP